jgi:hypothetical protein
MTVVLILVQAYQRLVLQYCVPVLAVVELALVQRHCSLVRVRVQEGAAGDSVGAAAFGSLPRENLACFQVVVSVHQPP